MRNTNMSPIAAPDCVYPVAMVSEVVVAAWKERVPAGLGANPGLLLFLLSGLVGCSLTTECFVTLSSNPGPACSDNSRETCAMSRCLLVSVATADFLCCCYDDDYCCTATIGCPSSYSTTTTAAGFFLAGLVLACCH